MTALLWVHIHVVCVIPCQQLLSKWIWMKSSFIQHVSCSYRKGPKLGTIQSGQLAPHFLINQIYLSFKLSRSHTAKYVLVVACKKRSFFKTYVKGLYSGSHYTTWNIPENLNSNLTLLEVCLQCDGCHLENVKWMPFHGVKVFFFYC